VPHVTPETNSKKSTIIGIAVGVTVGVAVLLAAGAAMGTNDTKSLSYFMEAIFLRRRNKRKELLAEPSSDLQLTEKKDKTQYVSTMNQQAIAPDATAYASLGTATGNEMAMRKLAPISSFPKGIVYSELVIEKELGRGAYGVVFLGTYRLQKVAIKKLVLQELTGTL
jgi:hypothetical protein